MKRKSSRRLALAVFACLGIAAIYGCYLAAFTQVTYYAHYPHMILESGTTHTEWRSLHTGDRKERTAIAPLYLDLDGKVYYLPDLTSQNIREYRRYEEPILMGGSVYIINENSYVFRDGRLVEATLDYYGPKIATKPDGPFRRILMSRAEAVNMFGEPDRIEKRRTKDHWVFK